MLARVVDFSARNQVLVILLTAALAVFGWWSMTRVPLDALPELGETQVIVYTRWDRSPQIVEDQVTYPIVSALLGAPGVTSVRGYSDFGYSFVYVVFDDAHDLYWARARTSEYLAGVQGKLPADAKPELGPDASGLGWIFQYVLQDDSGQQSLADLRSLQDWYLRYQLKSVPGVAEVAPLGGFSKQFQVTLDPNRLRAFGVTVRRVVEAVRGGNVESSGRLLEFGGTEYMIRGRGYAKSVQDLESIVLLATEGGTPVRIRDVGQVVIGPDQRRGVSELDGAGEAVSGIVVMRQGANARQVIDAVKAKLKQIEPGLPKGVRVVPVYDRSSFIDRVVAANARTILEVMFTVMVVILIFLRHWPSALIPAITIPTVVLIAFIPLQALGVTANVMSLGGIAIAIGALVDASIVVVEQAHKKLEQWDAQGRPGPQSAVILSAVQEVAGTSFFALLIIAAAFLPVLVLENQEGRLFTPMAIAKTLCMVIAAGLAITLDPALRLLLARFSAGSVRKEEDHPLSRWLIRTYEPAVWWALAHRRAVLSIAAGLMAVTIPVFLSLNSEFLPPLDEGTILYMPSTMPGISIAQAQQLLQSTDRVLRQFPEVEHVLGKAGRAETATDPAPLSMLETLVTLRPKDQWRKVDTWYSPWSPEWLKPLFRRITSDSMSTEQLIAEMNTALTLPGVSNSWTAPIRGRLSMLDTGMRTEAGVKISGPDPKIIEQTGKQIEALLRPLQGTRNVFAERGNGGFFVDVTWNREALARHGLSMEEAQASVQHAIGGENVSTIIDGLARYPVNVRYQRDFRSDLEAIGQVLVPAFDGRRQIPIRDLASIAMTEGPSMLRNEDGSLTGYVYVDVAGQNVGEYVEQAQQALRIGLKLPPGYTLSWSGQYLAMQRVRSKLIWIVPVTLFVIFLLLYGATRSYSRTLIVALAVPFSAIGAVWLVYLLGYNLSIAVWVGVIALMGLDAETGLFMLLYLDLAFEKARSEGRLRDIHDLRAAIVDGAAKRIRPKFMTVAAAFVGLLPVLWADGAGADVLKRIAAPMLGGLFTSFVLELLVYPTIYETLVLRNLRKNSLEFPQARV